MIVLINERGEEAGLSGLLLMNMKARRLCRHSPSVELVSPAPALASSQSVSQSASKQASKQRARLPHGHCVETFLNTTKVEGVG